MEKDKILELARTAFIELSDEQAERFISQLEEIVTSIESAVDSIDLKKVKDGQYYKLKLDLLMEDSPQKMFDRESMMMNVKRQKNFYVLVPKIIKEEK